MSGCFLYTLFRLATPYCLGWAKHLITDSFSFWFPWWHLILSAVINDSGAGCSLTNAQLFSITFFLLEHLRILIFFFNQSSGSNWLAGVNRPDGIDKCGVMFIEYAAFIFFASKKSKEWLFSCQAPFLHPFLPANTSDFPHSSSPPTLVHRDWLFFSHAPPPPLVQSSKSNYSTPSLLFQRAAETQPARTIGFSPFEDTDIYHLPTPSCAELGATLLYSLRPLNGKRQQQCDKFWALSRCWLECIFTGTMQARLFFFHFSLHGLVGVAFRYVTPQTQYWVSELEWAWSCLDPA